MKKLLLILLLASLFPLLAPGHETFRLEKKDSIMHVFKFSSPEKAKTVKIDNVFGSIIVSGIATSEARLEAKRCLRADNQDELLKAEREVKLNMAEKDNLLDIYVDGPFRSRDRSVDWSDPDYIVIYDFSLQVPEQTSLILRTVNDGDILVKNVKGDFIVRNVNGHIELQDIVGPASCKTVNGHIRAGFREDPVSACSFQTVNGDLDVSFSTKLAAEFQLRTLNGEIYSDFPASTLPGKAETEHAKNGRFIYRSHRFQGVRIGAGGPEIRMETLNGDIAIANKNKEK
ncbi:MAG: DUF4097 family beta strand repeat-containing protein [Candidatus Aminicenantes bacterium]|nr:DUF4097 family beta strand repeat-containing protein [Candidatus Aminicenantes bacterium]